MPRHPNSLTHEEIMNIALAETKTKMLTEDLTALALAAGVLPVAIPDVIARYAYKVKDGAKNFADFMAEETPEATHWFAPKPLGHGLDETLIESALGARPTMKARAALYNAAGATLYAQLVEAWGCDASLRPGRKPGADADDKVPAKKAVANDDVANNPFNPAKSYGPGIREKEIAKYVVQFGSKSAQRSAAKFNVDLAGRPLRASRTA